MGNNAHIKMKFTYFPTAIEVQYHHIIKNIYECMENARQSFIDIAITSHEIENYFTEKGFKVIDIRYDLDLVDKNKFGFYGRTSGDGICYKRFIWGNANDAMSTFGDFRV